MSNYFNTYNHTIMYNVYTSEISLVIYMLKLYFDITSAKSFHEMWNL
jgi:hypothetical protein